MQLDNNLDSSSKIKYFRCIKCFKYEISSCLNSFALLL